LKDPLDEQAFKAARPNGDRQLDDQLEAAEAKAGRCDLKSVAASNDDARNQCVHFNMSDAWAQFEFAPQRREIGIAPLPSRDFDANSVRRQMNDDRACRCIQGAPPGSAGSSGIGFG
jgi:hypothetical protein